MLNTITFNTFRFGLIPVVLFCGVIIAASIDSHVTNLAQKSNWSQTTVTVTDAEDVGTASFPDPHGTIRYVAEGKPHTWQGRGRDIGLTEMNPGEEITLYYNPDNPQQISTLILLGAGTGFLILIAALAFLAFYIWYFWLRGFLRRSGPGDSGGGYAAQPPSGGAPPSAIHTRSAGASFGRRG